MPMTSLVEPAPAKLNLALHVTGRRADGYHLLDSLVCFASVGDELHLSPGPLSLSIDGPFGEGLAPDDDNLCLRAARLSGAEAAIRLTKNLPVASGIGGGSADAAAVLRGLLRMGYELPPDLQRLGADVPVCLASASARMQGIGEHVTPLPALPVLHLVLANPAVALSTPQVFAMMEQRENPPLPKIPDFGTAGELIRWLRGTRNDLEEPARRLAPVIGEVLAALDATGAGFARMSGSGATCFGIFDSVGRAAESAGILARQGWWAVATELAQPLVPG
ncbi:4-(cytidine 5'-diphospho)-2-C-methyl-D-erythritol kinase [Paracoccus methylarcula]|uniref:4-diphosphocytidyl-2-C-methyl-D-erythritol kinase n=1 Tax=Paracoccus methylarcula TaxID=72022 RepID=A0A422QUE5_9RHOB|nr:4-(cytidine 5'-diphospho)-2-C-methyl-D-erythritol kinase [Paracoccus methylarcula]RNF33619.1 4-(cytidine 5'-diphospho)-2-C-methyl-D-erythritol kinase [Paracoccus methylarcula]